MVQQLWRHVQSIDGHCAGLSGLYHTAVYLDAYAVDRHIVQCAGDLQAVTAGCRTQQRFFKIELCIAAGGAGRQRQSFVDRPRAQPDPL